MRFVRQGAGLVGADHRGGPQLLHGRQPLDHAALSGQAPDSEGKGQGERWQQSLGNIGHDHAQGEHQALRDGERAGEDAEREEDRANRHGEHGHHAGDARHLDLQRARLLDH